MLKFRDRKSGKDLSVLNKNKSIYNQMKELQIHLLLLVQKCGNF